MSLEGELAEAREKVERCARDFGLDFSRVIFELLDWNEINVIASYGGFPSRYPHWRFGMEFEQMSKSYRYGLQKIYEMVINNDPCYAYLLRSNNMIDQKMVMAHVFGHADFFRNNVYFAQTNRKMIDEMGNHRAKIQRYVNRFGFDPVESFVDRCLSIENLIDIHHPMKGVRRHERRKSLLKGEITDELRKPAEPEQAFKVERDVLLFLIENAPLEPWERDVLSILREEACYFAPQGQTKILNEGWAAFWHSRIMTTKILNDSEVIDYASHHAATVSPSPGKLNPYKIGMELLRDIERRFGTEKIFTVRRVHNDLTFLDEFLTEDFCQEQKMFTYGFNQANGTYEIVDRDHKKVKEKLLASLTNLGSPIIQVSDGNYASRGELALKHLHEGVDIRLDWMKEVMKNLFGLWRHPVHLETLVEGVPKLFSFEGEECKEQRLT